MLFVRVFSVERLEGGVVQEDGSGGMKRKYFTSVRGESRQPGVALKGFCWGRSVCLKDIHRCSVSPSPWLEL